MSDTFFTKINYAACNEDSFSELKALNLTDQDTVLCITGSGARSLDLLIASPKKIISIDFNPTQNYLLELKIAAYKCLSYDDFTSFIGLNPGENRFQMYKATLSEHISIDANTFWNKNKPIINSGILYAGTWEKLLKGISKLAHLRQKTLSKLFYAKSLEEQIAIWDKQWNNWSWRFFLKLVCNRFLWTKIIREPGALLIPKDFNVYDYMYQKMEYLVHHHLLRESHYANLVFLGKYSNECILPIHLRKENYEMIKEKIHLIEPLTDSILNFLENNESKKEVTAYSLSDFSSYASTNFYESIWSKIIKNTDVSIKFCERHFLIKRYPEQKFHEIIRDRNLELELEQKDISFIYSFCAGTVQK